ncbi:MAG: flavin reductase [Bacteroidales bacterium]|nr:flavin reductase [Bacteroidales bacterium]
MFTDLNLNKFDESVFHLIGKQWMLITAGTSDSFNSMTASWGGFGFLWNMPVAFIFIRPQRFTKEFVEKNDFFTLTFFEKKHKNKLTFSGSHSGRDYDKVKETGLNPVETNLGNIYFNEARLVFECKKLYFDDLKPDHFLDRLISRNYPNEDYHRMFVGKIVNGLIRE